jgi:2-keto-4-pentenoate hydratase/2-oxohepta-3-ene-1,7-dioic acid hydratase in catechol pathway
MRIARVRVLSSGTEHYATLHNEEVHILSQPPFDEIIESGERVSMSEVRLLAPTVPVNYWGVGFNYADHLEQAVATSG